MNSCAINRTMIGMSIKYISVLHLCHVLKPFVKSTPGKRDNSDHIEDSKHNGHYTCSWRRQMLRITVKSRDVSLIWLNTMYIK